MTAVRPSARGRQGRGAFTLLELISAILILSLVMTVVYGTWSAGMNGWKRCSMVTDAFQRERVVMEALTEMTASLVFFDSTKQIYAVQGVHDQDNGDLVSFVTSSDAALPQTLSSVAGLRRVTLYLQRDEQGNPFLAIMNAPALQPPDASTEGEARALSADVVGFGVRYRDALDDTWKDKWDNVHSVPAAIEFTVAFGGTDRRVPPVIVTRAVDIPMAITALEAQGLQPNDQSTTNQVDRQNISLMQSQGAGTERPPQ